MHMSIPFIFFLNLLYLIGLGALLALNDIEADLVALIDCDTGLQASYMNEIVLTIVASYESKAFDSIEKLYCSSYHFLFLNTVSPLHELQLLKVTGSIQMRGGREQSCEASPLRKGFIEEQILLNVRPRDHLLEDYYTWQE